MPLQKLEKLCSIKTRVNMKFVCSSITIPLLKSFVLLELNKSEGRTNDNNGAAGYKSGHQPPPKKVQFGFQYFQ
jgi:hypothetical protein